MIVKVFHGKHFDSYTTASKILETYANKEKAQAIVNDLINFGYHVRPIKGTNDNIKYEIVKDGQK